MTKQLSPSVTHPTVAEVYQNIRSKKLILRPDFQRRFVWTHEHQEEFLETIFKGYPFPEIYVCRGEIDVINLTTTQHVIDGQQRLTTIQRYIEEGGQGRKFQKFPPYSELSDQEKKEFLSYQIVMRDLGDIDDGLIREIFRRINLTKFKLEDVEIHNAIYNGKFIQTAREVLSNINLRSYDVFYESEFTRMADLHFMLLIMSTIENGGYFPQDKEVETYIAQYNDEYPNADTTKSLLVSTFSAIDNLKLKQDSIWFRKSSFFTMVVEFAFHKVELPSDIVQRLENMEKNVLDAKLKPNSDFGQYYSYMYTGTTSRKARVERATVFNTHVFSEGARNALEVAETEPCLPHLPALSSPQHT